MLKMEIEPLFFFFFFSRIDRLPAIIVWQYFPYYQIWKLRPKQIAPALINSMSKGHELWSAGKVVQLEEDLFTVLSGKSYEVKHSAFTCECDHNRMGHPRCKHWWAVDLFLGNPNLSHTPLEATEIEEDKEDLSFLPSVDLRGQPKATKPLFSSRGVPSNARVFQPERSSKGTQTFAKKVGRKSKRGWLLFHQKNLKEENTETELFQLIKEKEKEKDNENEQDKDKDKEKDNEKEKNKEEKEMKKEEKEKEKKRSEREDGRIKGSERKQEEKEEQGRGRGTGMERNHIDLTVFDSASKSFESSVQKEGFLNNINSNKEAEIFPRWSCSSQENETYWESSFQFPSFFH